MRGLGIAMDSNWKPLFVLEGDTARAAACLIRPYNAAVADPSLGWENARYWAAPHGLVMLRVGLSAQPAGQCGKVSDVYKRQGHHLYQAADDDILVVHDHHLIHPISPH